MLWLGFGGFADLQSLVSPETVLRTLQPVSKIDKAIKHFPKYGFNALNNEVRSMYLFLVIIVICVLSLRDGIKKNNFGGYWLQY